MLIYIIYTFLGQMIVGLPADEREELLKMVAQRASAAGEMHEGVSSPREVYDFQLTAKTGIEAAAGAGMTPSMTEKGAMAMPAKMKIEKKDGMKDSTCEGSDKATMKLMEKMEKYRGKIAKNTMKLARAQRMLAVADILIAQGVDAQVPASSYTVHCVSSSYFCKQTIQTRCKALTRYTILADPGVFDGYSGCGNSA